MTPERNFFELLEARQAAGFHLCVGLDTSPDALPECCIDLEPPAASWIKFNEAIVAATAPFAAAFKPNLAFYESRGETGWTVLRRTTEYILGEYPHIPIIGDGKRADIGATNLNYVTALFDQYGCDAATVHAWHGMEAMRPFLDRGDKGIIVVVRTSNPGADEFQKRMVVLNEGEREEFPAEHRDELTTCLSYPAVAGSNQPILWGTSQYRLMAHRVARYWNAVSGNCAVVAGATYPEDVAAVRAIIGEDMQILGPGFGKQAADVRSAVRALRNRRGTRFIGNSSSGITGASKGEDFAEAAGREAQALHELFTQYRLEA